MFTSDFFTTERRARLSAVMHLAWQFIRKNGMSRAAALRLAWANTKLREKMRGEIVRFTYQKVDGTLRQAYGTLKEGLTPATKGTGRRPNPTLQTYFDTEKDEWRCFKVANLIAADI